MDSRKVSSAVCPACGEVLDGVTCAEAPCPQPKPGDLTICIYCSTVLRFKKNGTLGRMPMNQLNASEMAYMMFMKNLIRESRKAARSRSGDTPIE